MPPSDAKSVTVEDTAQDRSDEDLDRLRLKLRRSMSDTRPDLSGDEVMDRLASAEKAFDTREKG